MIIACIIELFVGYLPDEFYNNSTSLYFFSALLQANAALFSIYGVFVIFKLQGLKSTIDAYMIAFLQNKGMSINSEEVLDFEVMNIEDKRKHIEKISKDNTRKKYLEAWLKKENKIEATKKGIKNIIGCIAIIIILNAMGLISAFTINKLGVRIEFTVHTVFLISEIMLLKTLVGSINKLLKDDMGEVK